MYRAHPYTKQNCFLVMLKSINTYGTGKISLDQFKAKFLSTFTKQNCSACNNNENYTSEEVLEKVFTYLAKNYGDTSSINKSLIDNIKTVSPVVGKDGKKKM